MVYIVEDFWAAFYGTRGMAPIGDAPVTSFGDCAEQQDALCALVLAGRKRATASLARWYGPGLERMPAPGDFAVVVDGGGRPRCVIELVAVEVVRFCDVDEVFAAEEGEADGSLAYWQAEHRWFFAAALAAEDSEFSEAMMVVCERFRVVWAPAGDDGFC